MTPSHLCINHCINWTNVAESSYIKLMIFCNKTITKSFFASSKSNKNISTNSKFAFTTNDIQNFINQTNKWRLLRLTLLPTLNETAKVLQCINCREYWPFAIGNLSLEITVQVAWSASGHGNYSSKNYVCSKHAHKVALQLYEQYEPQSFSLAERCISVLRKQALVFYFCTCFSCSAAAPQSRLPHILDWNMSCHLPEIGASIPPPELNTGRKFALNDPRRIDEWQNYSNANTLDEWV